MLKGESHVSRNESQMLWTVDDGDNYVTFHGLNVRIKIKTITKAQLDSVSNRELKRGLNRTAVLLSSIFR